MDPIGLTFEMYDHVGEPQLDANPDIDPSGQLFEQEIKMGPLQMPLSLHTV